MDYLLKPFYKRSYQFSISLLGLSVREFALSIELLLPLMPLDHEVSIKHFLIIKHLHEGWGEFLLIRILLDKVLYDSLHEMLYSEVSILSNLVKKAFFILGPGLNDVPFFREETTHEDVVFKLIWEIE